MSVWSRYKNAKASAALPFVLAFTAPFFVISTCERTDKKSEVQPELRVAISDVDALCKDWLYYRKKIIQYTEAGETDKAERARARFRQMNSMLSQFPESSVNAAFLRLEENGYKP
jgi:hypothetical protein